ncbi:dTMP kinase [Arcobacter sp. 15-2]|uniref:dTMP kinase n=1 Tax=Arcobacter sp. 15-2 TaxID=3374109 RepID=UPI00399D0528
MYVLLEGIDTAGKSTQLEILKQKYPEAIFTKEPGGTELGLKLREMVLSGEAKSKVAEMFLFLADRAEHSFQVVKKLKDDNILISDRGFLSGIAYAKTAPLEIAISLNIMALNGAMPDKIIILELSKEELEFRLSQKEQDSIEKRGSNYLLNIQQRMIDAINMINTMGEKTIDLLIIDATKSVDIISKEIETFLEK